MIHYEDENHPMFVRLKELVDHIFNLSLEKRNFLNEGNVNEYNKSLLNMEHLASNEDINFNLFDTTNKSIREISFEVADTILSDMRIKCVDELQKMYE